MYGVSVGQVMCEIKNCYDSILLLIDFKSFEMLFFDNLRAGSIPKTMLQNGLGDRDPGQS
jgi:hypothetical protein